MLDVVAGERSELVFLEKVVYTHAQQLRDETYVVAVIEPLYEMDTFAEATTVSMSLAPWPCRDSLQISWISFLQLLQHAHFHLTRIAILLDGTDNLDSDSFVGFGVDCFDHLAKGALSKEAHCAVWAKAQHYRAIRDRL